MTGRDVSDSTVGSFGKAHALGSPVPSYIPAVKHSTLPDPVGVQAFRIPPPQRLMDLQDFSDPLFAPSQAKIHPALKFTLFG